MIQHCDRRTGRDYLQARLSPSHETQFLQHLDVCPRCREWLEVDAGGETVCADVQRALAKSGTSVIIPPLVAHSLESPELTIAVGNSSDPPSWESDDDAAQQNSAREQGLEIARSILGPTDRPDALGRIGNYEVLGIVGQGGMGIVFKAFDPPLNRIVAIKVIDPILAKVAAARQRFAREARAMASVAHENVVPIHAVSEHRGLPYFVMEYVPGQSLEQRILTNGPLSPVETVRIGLQTAQALAAAHRQGLIHRDIKPGNLLLQAGVDRVLVTDFGLARVVDDANMTQSGLLAGTPQYMAPEHVTGSPSDPRSDLFSLGCVMYAMCCGHSPFRAETVYQVMQRIVHDAPRSLLAQHPGVPAWLEGLIVKLLAKSPSDRFCSAEQVVDVLAAELAHLQNPAGVQRPQRTWWEKARKATPAEPRRVNRHAGARWLTGPRRSWLIGVATVAGTVLALAFVLVPSSWFFAPVRQDTSASPARGQATPNAANLLSVPLPSQPAGPTVGSHDISERGELSAATAPPGRPRTALPAEWTQLWHSDDGLSEVQVQLQVWETTLHSDTSGPSFDAWSMTAEQLRERMSQLQREWERDLPENSALESPAAP